MITAKDLNQEREIECVVLSAGKPYLKIISVKYECPACGTVLSCIQLDDKLREPNRCSCGRRSGFTIIEQDTIEAQEIIIADTLNNFYEYKVYVETRELIDEFLSFRKITSLFGEIKDEYKRGSNKGEFVIYAKKFKGEKK